MSLVVSARTAAPVGVATVSNIRNGEHNGAILSATLLAVGPIVCATEKTKFSIENVSNGDLAQKSIRLKLEGLAGDGVTVTQVGSFIVAPGQFVANDWAAVPRLAADLGRVINRWTVDLVEAPAAANTLATAYVASTIAQVTGGPQSYSLILSM